VVDQSSRVYGVRGLRVCDASILPTVPASNPMWTTMMVAERIGVSVRDGRDVGGVERRQSRGYHREQRRATVQEKRRREIRKSGCVNIVR
jgi:hypothetical protein